MPENRPAVVRDERGRIVSGTPNPGGRPRLLREFHEWLATEAYPEAQAALMECLRSDNEKVKMIAVKEIYDRLFGRPAQTIIASIDDRAERPTIDLSQLTDEELRALEILKQAQNRLEAKP